MNCPQCGAPLDANTTKCKYCGEPIAQQAAPQQSMPQQQAYQQQPYQNQQQYNNPNSNMMAEGINPSWPIKDKAVAGILAIFLGGLGIHKFYLGKVGLGIVYLLFCWTGLPSVIGFIEGIIYLASNDHNFQVKNRVRLK